jgi:CubicO group peptidase (beta-lactamase class C family)
VNPPGVRRIIGGPGAPPQVFPEAKAIAPPKNDAELAEAISQLAGELAATGHYSGSIYLAKGGTALVNKAWGLADQEKKVPNAPDTAFDIGSIGKLLTQIAIVQLVEQGKIELDVPFGNYLKDYPNRQVADQVTVRQLLLHTGGLGDIFDRITPDTNLAGMTELKDFTPLFVNRPLTFAPGKGNRYSNAGYIVLGLVIEAASGENYFDYISKHILTPAKMERSGFFDRRNLPASVARSYNRSDDMTLMHPGRGSSAGGMQASAADLARLVESVNDGRLLKPDSVKTLRQFMPPPPPAGQTNQEIKIADASKLSGQAVAGGAPGVSAELLIDASGQHTLVVLCNADPPMAMSMALTIREWLKQYN